MGGRGALLLAALAAWGCASSYAARGLVFERDSNLFGKGSTQTLSYLALIGPDNVGLPLTGLTSVKGKSQVLAATLPTSGTWTVRVRAAGGNPGDVNYSLKVAEPKGVVYQQD